MTVGLVLVCSSAPFCEFDPTDPIFLCGRFGVANPVAGNQIGMVELGTVLVTSAAKFVRHSAGEGTSDGESFFAL